MLAVAGIPFLLFFPPVSFYELFDHAFLNSIHSHDWEIDRLQSDQ